mgnify:CR=1 FL=1
MGRIVTLLLSAILLLSSSVIYNASAQTFLPDIEIECDPESRIEVYPGSTYSGFFTCTLSNPTAYSEEVEVTITSGPLLSMGPGTVTVGPSATLDIQISLKIDMVQLVPPVSVQNIAVETKAVVVSFNGIDATALPEASDTADTSAMIMEYYYPTIELTEFEITITSGQDYAYDVIYGNNGNGNFDKMLIGIVENNRDQLETLGFSIHSTVQSVEIESGQTAKIRWEIRAPQGVTSENYYTIDFYVTSEFSCRYEGFCNTQSISLTVKVVPEEEEGGLASLTESSTVTYSTIGGAILAAAVAIVIFMKRKKSATFEQQDFEEDYEEDIDDDFEEDFEDDFFDDL